MAQRLDNTEHLHQHHLYTLCCIRLPQQHETTTTHSSVISAPCTVDTIGTGKIHCEAYGGDMADKT